MSTAVIYVRSIERHLGLCHVSEDNGVKNKMETMAVRLTGDDHDHIHTDSTK